MFNPRTLLLALACLLPATLVQADLPLRDPMRPPGYETSQAGRPGSTPRAPRYRLASIIIAPQRRLAVINGTQLAEGERLGDAIVQRIEPERVILRIGNRQQILTLVPARIKTPSNEATP